MYPLSAPLALDIILTERCNHRCPHCYNPTRNNRNCNSPNQDSIDHIYSIIRDNGITGVTITGGEPLIEHDMLLLLLSKLKELGVSVSINTNITLLNKYYLKEIINISSEISLLISLPSIEENECDIITGVRGSYKKIISNLEMCLKEHVDVGLNIVITNHNRHIVPNIKLFVQKYRVTFLSISPVISSDAVNCCDNSIYDEIIKELLYIKEHLGINTGSVEPFPMCQLSDPESYMSLEISRCNAGISKICVNVVDGNVFPCDHHPHSFGNIYGEKLQTIWNRMNEWRDSKILPDSCRNCCWFHLCGGSCRIQKIIEINAKKEELNIKKTPIKTDIKLKWNKNVRIRKESLGYSISFGGNYIQIKKSAMPLLEIMMSLKSFSINTKYVHNTHIIHDMIFTLLLLGYVEIVD